MMHSRVFETRSIWCVATSGDRCALCTSDSCMLLDPHLNKVRTTICGFKGHVTCAAFSLASSLIAAGILHGVVQVADCSNGAFVATLLGGDASGAVGDITFSPDGTLLAAAFISGSIQIWHVGNWDRPPTVLTCQRWVFTLAFSCDGRALVVPSGSNVLRMWRIADDGTACQQLDIAVNTDPYHTNPNNDLGNVCVAFSPIDKDILAFSDIVTTIARMNTDKSLSMLHRFPIWASDLLFSPCGRRLAVVSENIKLLDVTSGARLCVMDEHSVTGVAFTANGKQLVSVSNEVKIWTVCKWSARDHHLFNPEFRRRVVWVLCARARLAKAKQNMPYEIWRMIFQSMV